MYSPYVTDDRRSLKAGRLSVCPIGLVILNGVKDDKG